MIEKNIELSIEFSRYLFDHPEMDELISPESEIVLLPEFDDDLRKFNMQIGKNIESTEKKVAYIKIEKLRPKILSRIEGVSLDMEAPGKS